MHRDMSFDLDAAFSTRNEGELISTRPAKTQVLRTPGLTVLTPDEFQTLPSEGDDPMGVPSDSPLAVPEDSPAAVEGMGALPSWVPGASESQQMQDYAAAKAKAEEAAKRQKMLLYVGLAAAAGLAVYFLFLRKK